MAREMTLVLRNSLSEIPRIAEAVEHFFESNALPPAAQMHVTLSLDELATNAITYGFPDHVEHDTAITIRLRMQENELVAIMEDCGKSFDPLSVQPPDTELGLDEREIGGLGVHFVREFMTHVEYQRVDGLNRLTMRKTLVGPSSSEQ